MLAELRQDTPQARPGPQVLGVDLDRGVVPLPGRRKIASPVEQLGEREHDRRRRPLGLEHRSQRLGRLGEFTGCLEIIGEIEDLGGLRGGIPLGSALRRRRGGTGGGHVDEPHRGHGVDRLGGRDE